MAYKLVPTSQFKKDYKRAKKRRYDMRALSSVIYRLCSGLPLEERHKDYALAGSYRGFRECHIMPDWLLVYAIDADKLILTASRTGTHSDLFDE